MADLNQKQGDIEIYVRDLQIDQFKNWLDQNFLICEIKPNKKEDVYRGKVRQTNDSHDVELVVLIGSAGKAFSSVWFKSSDTPWENDLECARSFAKTAEAEVRCSPGSWEEDDEQNDNQWWRVTKDSETLIKW